MCVQRDSGSGNRKLTSSRSLEETAGWVVCAGAEDGKESVCNPNRLSPVQTPDWSPQQTSCSGKPLQLLLLIAYML